MNNNDQLNDDLNVFADELRQQSLTATVPDRDQLMFVCGKAAASQTVEPRPGRPSNTWLKQGLIIACSVCFGAFLMYQDSDSSAIQTSDTIVDTAANTKPTDALAAKVEELYSVDQIAAVRSNQLLCASSNPNGMPDFGVAPVTTIPIDGPPTIRARALNQIDLMP